MNELMLVAINLTRRCNLGCAHCYLDAATLRDGNANELSTAEIRALLDDISGHSPDALVVLTGGEPLVRKDVEDIAAHGHGLGLAIVVGTNGMLLTDRRVRSLKAAGVMGAGISVDSLDPGYHDRFRGSAGAWQKTMDGIDACRRHGLAFQLHFTITNSNADELGAMIEFARSSGAKVMNVFFLICTGRGRSFEDISPARYEQALGEVIEAQQLHPDLIIRPRCAPHFKRVAFQRASDSMMNRISGRDGDGCIAGLHYCRITPEGAVTACPYIDDEVGNIKTSPFVDIWETAPDLKALRAPKLKGNCGKCEFRLICGGCRARPVAQGGSLMDGDPICGYQPGGAAVIEPLQDQAHGAVSWAVDAEARLGRIPGFVRKMVRKRAEAYAAEQGASEVTTEHLEVLSARRFGGNPPFGARPPIGKRP
ncbi:MAG: radical SAM protein [Sphingomonadales bacterium]